ncbi:MAG: hypothetical protein RLZZ500_1711 [Bacteroidota bacterium]|jgi:hypothetical protein
MCTVSFVPINGKIVITSNRDEKTIRTAAIPPQQYTVQQKNLLFPKDTKAGGTWFVVDSRSNVGVLLNGASENHVRQENYRKSRGLIVLDIMSGVSPIKQWVKIDLHSIEPFTLVLYEGDHLYQLQWDGMKKNSSELDTSQQYIWSSSTLYTKEIRELRTIWFEHYLNDHPEIDADDMFFFHRYTENSDSENGLVINRDSIYKTVSITQVVLEKNRGQMHYADLLSDQTFQHNFISI